VKLEDIEVAVTVNLNKYRDMEMILLKGHLILEQAINHLINIHVKDPQKIDSLNLMFAKKTDLLMALIGKQFSSEERHLKEINRIRNKLAHEFFFDKYHKELKSRACSVNGYTPKTINNKKTYKNTVTKAFSFLTGLLIGIAQGIKATQTLVNVK
jgi:hypothetical protein